MSISDEQNVSNRAAYGKILKGFSSKKKKKTPSRGTEGIETEIISKNFNRACTYANINIWHL
jgi:hypothetical protein